MGTGLTWDFAAASDRGMLQRAQDGLDEEIASLSNKFMEAAGDLLSTSCDLATTGVGASRASKSSRAAVSLRNISLFSPISPRVSPAQKPWRATRLIER